MSAQAAMLAGIAKRVQAGAEFLDRREPGWWRKGRIDLDRLDLASACGCVLGQLHTHKCGNPVLHYHHARDEYGVTEYLGPDVDGRLGFDISDEGDEDQEHAEYEALTAEWKRVITVRRKTSVA